MKKQRNNSKQKKFQHYKKQQACSKRGVELKGGLVGFLATCDQFKEKRCVKELFNLLNDFTDKVYPEMDQAELFAEWKKQDDLAKAKALAAREAIAATNAAAEAEKIKAQEGKDGDGDDVAQKEPAEPIKVEAVDPKDDGQVEESKTEQKQEQEQEEEVKEPPLKRPRLDEAGTSSAPPKEGHQDIMKGLQDEIEQVKKKGNRLFYVFDMQVPGAIFIKLADWARPHVDVKRVGQEIAETVKRTGELSTRFACRLLPVDFLCKANNFDDFKQFARPVLEKHFPMREGNSARAGDTDNKKHVQWNLEFKRRNNEKFAKKDYVDYFTEQFDPEWTSVSYDYAEVDVVVEIFRDMLIMSVLPGYKTDFKKYNMQMLAGREDSQDEQAKPAPVKVADLIRMRKEKQQNQDDPSKQVEEEIKEAEDDDDDEDDNIVYKAKIDILDEIEAAEKAAMGKEAAAESSEDDGPQLI